MHVERYVDPDAFLAVAARLAAANPPLVAFVHSWVDGVRRAERSGRVFMAVAHASGDTGFAVQRDDGPVLLGACSDAAARSFADALADAHPDLDGVAGSEPACTAFCARWRELTGYVQRVRVRTRNHVLTRLALAPSVPGRMRIADRQSDGPFVRATLRAFADEANMPMSDATLERLVRERLCEGTYRIWEHEAQSVAFAGYSVAGPDASRIAPVYTLPAFRRRGYAGALVGALCAALLEQRRRVFLVTDLANPASNALYRRLGFEPLDDAMLCDLVAPT